MHKRRMILEPVYAQAPAEGAAQGGGQGQQAGAPAQLPAGVQPGSAAASVVQGQQDPQQGQDTGPAGGKEAVLADLAKERQQRHAAEQQVAELTKKFDQLQSGLAQAFGVQGTQATPEQLQAQAQQVQTQQNQAMTQLAVHQLAATAGADPVKLLDSASFLSSINSLQPTDHAGITAAIKAAVERNKSLAAVRSGAGSSDAGTTRGAGQQQASISDLLRAAAGR